MSNKLDCKKYKNIYAFLESEIVEKFFFSLLCASEVTAVLCHWILDIGYKYRWYDKTANVVDYNWIFYICIPIVLYYLVRKGKARFDFGLVLLIQGLVLGAVLDYQKEQYVAICYAWIVPIAYIIGKLAVTYIEDGSTQRLKSLYIILLIACFVVSGTDFYNNYRFVRMGWLSFQTDMWPSFWMGDKWENRCTYELGFVLTTSALGYAILNLSREKVFSLFVIIGNIIIQYLDIQVTGRENRLLLPINLFIVGIMLLYDNKSKILTIEKYRKIISTIIIAGFIVAICFVICFKLNVAGIYAAYLQSNWASDGGILRNARFSLDIDGFQRMLSNPLDDYVEQGYEHSHSLMLEYGRAFGFSVYLMLSVFRLLTLKDALVFAQNVKDNAIKYLVVPGILSLNIYYSLEPNGYEHRHIWMLGLFISGMIRGKLDLIKQDKTERFIGRIEVL